MVVNKLGSQTLEEVTVQTLRKAPIKYVVTFTNLKFRLVTPYRSLVIDQ